MRETLDEDTLRTELKRGTNGLLEKLEVSGTVRVLDKDGNLKFTQEITSIEVRDEDENNAT